MPRFSGMPSEVPSLWGFIFLSLVSGLLPGVSASCYTDSGMINVDCDTNQTSCSFECLEERYIANGSVQCTAADVIIMNGKCDREAGAVYMNRFLDANTFGLGMQYGPPSQRHSLRNMAMAMDTTSTFLYVLSNFRAAVSCSVWRREQGTGWLHYVTTQPFDFDGTRGLRFVNPSIILVDPTNRILIVLAQAKLRGIYEYLRPVLLSFRRDITSGAIWLLDFLEITDPLCQPRKGASWTGASFNKNGSAVVLGGEEFLFTAYRTDFAFTRGNCSRRGDVSGPFIPSPTAIGWSPQQAIGVYPGGVPYDRAVAGIVPCILGKKQLILVSVLANFTFQSPFWRFADDIVSVDVWQPNGRDAVIFVLLTNNGQQGIVTIPYTLNDVSLFGQELTVPGRDAARVGSVSLMYIVATPTALWGVTNTAAYWATVITSEGRIEEGAKSIQRICNYLQHTDPTCTVLSDTVKYHYAFNTEIVAQRFAYFDEVGTTLYVLGRVDVPVDDLPLKDYTLYAFRFKSRAFEGGYGNGSDTVMVYSDSHEYGLEGASGIAAFAPRNATLGDRTFVVVSERDAISLVSQPNAVDPWSVARVCINCSSSLLGPKNPPTEAQHGGPSGVVIVKDDIYVARYPKVSEVIASLSHLVRSIDGSIVLVKTYPTSGPPMRRAPTNPDTSASAVVAALDTLVAVGDNGGIQLYTRDNTSPDDARNASRLRGQLKFARSIISAPGPLRNCSATYVLQLKLISVASGARNIESVVIVALTSAQPTSTGLGTDFVIFNASTGDAMHCVPSVNYATDLEVFDDTTGAHHVLLTGMDSSGLKGALWAFKFSPDFKSPPDKRRTTREILKYSPPASHSLIGHHAVYDPDSKTIWFFMKSGMSLFLVEELSGDLILRNISSFGSQAVTEMRDYKDKTIRKPRAAFVTSMGSRRQLVVSDGFGLAEYLIEEEPCPSVVKHNSSCTDATPKCHVDCAVMQPLNYYFCAFGLWLEPIFCAPSVKVPPVKPASRVLGSDNKGSVIALIVTMCVSVVLAIVCGVALLLATCKKEPSAEAGPADVEQAEDQSPSTSTTAPLRQEESKKLDRTMQYHVAGYDVDDDVSSAEVNEITFTITKDPPLQTQYISKQSVSQAVLPATVTKSSTTTSS